MAVRGRSWTTTIEYAGTVWLVVLPVVAEPIEVAFLRYEYTVGVLVDGVKPL